MNENRFNANLVKYSEKAMAPHSSTLAWKIPWMEEPGRLQSMGSLRVGHDWATSLSCIGEGNGNPLQCSCLENPRDGEPGGCRLWDHTESDTTEQLPFHFPLSCIGEGNGNPPQCSCLENGGAWWAAVYGVVQSQTRLTWLSSSSSIHVYTLKIVQLKNQSYKYMKNKDKPLSRF